MTGVDLLIKAAQEFIDKCDRGEARSVRTYKALSEALDQIKSEKSATKYALYAPGGKGSTGWIVHNTTQVLQFDTPDLAREYQKSAYPTFNLEVREFDSKSLENNENDSHQSI